MAKSRRTSKRRKTVPKQLKTWVYRVKKYSKDHDVKLSTAMKRLRSSRRRRRTSKKSKRKTGGKRSSKRRR